MTFRFDFGSRCAGVALLLQSLVSSDSPALTANPLVGAEPLYWSSSSATSAFLTQDEGLPAAAAAALNELAFVTALLDERIADIAYASYCAALEHAVEAFHLDQPPRTATLRQLTSQLQLARAELLDQVSSLSDWLKLVDAMGVPSDQYLQVPERFHSSEEIALAQEAFPSVVDFEAALEVERAQSV